MTQYLERHNESSGRLAIKTSRDSFFMIQYLEHPFVCGNPNEKESKWQNRLLMLFCDGLCELLVTMQQQHFAASNDLHEHSRKHAFWKGSMKMEHSKMRSESSEFSWRAKAILIHLKNYFEECAQEVWVRNGMSPDLHTTWWNVKTRKTKEMILTVFRGFFLVN